MAMTMDDDEFDYWFNASDKEVDREEVRIDAQMVELKRNLSKMTIPQQVAHHRHFLLMDIMQNRRRMLDPTLNTIDIVSQMWRDGLRRNQVRLVKLRIWRATGVYPGSA